MRLNGIHLFPFNKHIGELEFCFDPIGLNLNPMGATVTYVPTFVSTKVKGVVNVICYSSEPKKPEVTPVLSWQHEGEPYRCRCA